MNPTDTGQPITLLRYNLWHGRAQRELVSLVATHAPDVLCLQEASTFGLPTRIGDLRVACSTSRNRLGIALYVRADLFTIEQAAAVKLSVSRHDRLVGGTDLRLAAARVHDRVAGRDLVLGSFHGTPFTDSNAFRRLQVDDAHAALTKLGPGLPTLMAGDYNHPILLGMLRRHLKRRGFTVARSPGSTFHKEGSLMRGKFDIATVSGLDVVGTATLPQGASDHRPVKFTLRYAAAPGGRASPGH